MNYFHMIAEQNIARLRKQQEENERNLEAYKRRVEWLEMTDPQKWSESDFDVRFRNGKTESYNKHTGKVLYTYPNCEQFTVTEAWRDIRDEFRGN